MNSNRCAFLIYWHSSNLHPQPKLHTLDAVIRVLDRMGYDVITGPEVEEFDIIFVRYNIFDRTCEGNVTKKMTPRHLVIY